MKQAMAPCETDIPDNGIWDNYNNLTNSTCSFCAARCAAPDIDNSVGFFDGFQSRVVGITYGAIIGFTIIWQIYICLYRNKKIQEEWDALAANGRDSFKGQKINQTLSSKDQSYEGLK